MIEDRRDEATAAAFLNETERGVGEGRGRGSAIDALGQYLGFALRPDLPGRALVRSSRTLLNANSPDGAAHDPVP